MIKTLLRSLAIGLVALGVTHAEPVKWIANPFTNKQDYITKIDSNTIIPGVGVLVVCTNGTCTLTAAGTSASNLEVFSGPVRSSPTPAIGMNPNDISAIMKGATFYFSLNPATTNYIHNQTTPQTATFNTSSGTASTQFNTQQLKLIALNCTVMHKDGTCLLSTPDVNSMYWGYNSNLINTGGVFNLAVGPTAMPYPGSGNFNSAIGPFAMSGNVITTAENNNAMGYASCGALRAGFYNNCMGGSAGNLLRDGNYNTNVGAYAGRDNVDRNGNTHIGFESGKNHNGGDYEITIGYQAGQGTTTVENADFLGSGNTYVGKQTGQGVSSATVISNSIALGNGALVSASGEAQIGGRNGTNLEVNLRASSMTVESMAVNAGKCVQWGTNGTFTSAAAACGGSGGGSAIDLTPGDTDYIQVRNTLQVGSTYYVSSGTVNTFTVNTSLGIFSSLNNKWIANNPSFADGDSIFPLTWTGAPAGLSTDVLNGINMAFGVPITAPIPGSAVSYNTILAVQQNGWGVKSVASASSSSGNVYGGYFSAAGGASGLSYGVYGESTVSASNSSGVYGTMNVSGAATDYGVRGVVTGGDALFHTQHPTMYAVHGNATSTDSDNAARAYGLWGSASGAGRNYGLWVDAGQAVFKDSATVQGSQGLNVVYNVTSGSETTGTVRYGLSSISGNYTATSTSTVILADATGGSLTVTLPTSVGNTGLTYRIKRLNSGANNVTIATTSSQTIDGATTQILNVQYTSVDLVSDGSNWSIL